MKRVLLTGMSGVGKSTIGLALQERGYRTVDLDYGYCQQDGSWDERLVGALLSEEGDEFLFVIGAADNQPRFYHRFDVIVLVSAPEEVMVQRLQARINNPFEKSKEEMSKILRDRRTYEPMIRNRAHHELRSDRAVEEIVDELLNLVNSDPPTR